MATVRNVSRLVPSAERTAVVTDVVAGDNINIEDVLGRPARGIKIVPDDSTDSVSVRYNNRIRIPQYHVNSRDTYLDGCEKPESVHVVSEGAQHPVHTYTGAAEYYSEEGVRVSFIQVDAITFGAGGTSISIHAW